MVVSIIYNDYPCEYPWLLGGGYVPRSGIVESKGRMGIVKPRMFNMTACMSCVLRGTGKVGERTGGFLWD